MDHTVCATRAVVPDLLIHTDTHIERAAVKRRPGLGDGGAAETWGRSYERVEVSLSPNGTCTPTIARKAGSLEGISIPATMIDVPGMAKTSIIYNRL